MNTVRLGAAKHAADIHDALERGFSAPIRDVLWGHVYLTTSLEALATSPAFMRLHRIMQLGPTHIVYPGATHTRAAHSIGVYYLARRLLRNFVAAGADSWLTGAGARSFLCAALLHDLGHFPYTHSLKELPLASHEALTGQLILAEPVKTLVGNTGADPYLCAAIIDTALPAHGNQELLFYRKLLSGALDPDKLDYLNRDARYCGVPYGAQDVDFILSRLRPDPEEGVSIDARVIPSVESLLFSKYLMYRTVYWHPAVRSASAMIKKVVVAALKSGSIAREELYHLDDQGLFALLAARSHGGEERLFALGEKVRDGRLYAVAAEFAYDAEKHSGLAEIEQRSLYEEELAAELSAQGQRVLPEELIIDVPEPVSFETGLAVRGESLAGVFTADTVAAFKAALRVVRVFVDQRLLRGEAAVALRDVLKRKEKWI
jgi:HD superfamily phosphohydrolase